MKKLSGEKFLGSLPQNAEALLLMLHGYGADAAGMLGLYDDYAPHFPSLAIFSLEAPFENEQHCGRQWFSLQGYRPEHFIGLQHQPEAAQMLRQMDEEIAKSFNYMRENIAEIAKLCGLAQNRTALLGFSQGASMALGYALTSGEETLGALSFSGLSTFIPENIKRKPAVFLAHGDADAVVPFSSLVRSCELLEQAGVKVRACPVMGLGHTINGEEIRESISFLKPLVAGAL